MIILESAYKHGIGAEDIVYVLSNPQKILVIDEDQNKVLVLGADTKSRFLEVIYVVKDNGTLLVIHAMKIRKIYQRLLEK